MGKKKCWNCDSEWGEEIRLQFELAGREIETRIRSRSSKNWKQYGKEAETMRQQ